MRFNLRLILAITGGVAIVVASARVSAIWMPAICSLVCATISGMALFDRRDWRQFRLHGLARGTVGGAGLGAALGNCYYGFTMEPGYQAILRFYLLAPVSLAAASLVG